MHNEHHQQQINGLLIIVATLIVGALLLFLIPGKRAEAPAPVVTEPTPVQTDTRTVYSSPEYGVTIRYGADFTAQPTTEGTSFYWNSTAVPAQNLFRISLPKSFQPNTNFSEASLSLSTTDHSLSAKNCLIAQNGEVASGMKNSWAVFKLGDAGAGNYYETTSYRMLKNGACVALDAVVHSVAVGNYPPEFGIKEFDHIAVNQKLDEVIDSVTVQ